MIVGVPAAREPETRVAMTPAVAEDLIEVDHEVHVESGAGEGAGWDDVAYREAGCEIRDDRESVLADAEVVFEVTALGAVDDPDPTQYREGQVVVGMLGPFGIDDATQKTLAEGGVTALAIELVPRISRAQSMDANSSQANVAGYKAAVQAAEQLDRMVPMQMTAAGTVQPAEVFVIGAGVAGLQAISTADRLGASVSAYDIRPEAAEEITSVGAEFVELDVHTDDASDEEGHAVEQDEEFYRKQRDQLGEVVAESDALITTAAVASGEAPRLVTDEAIAAMDDGSVVIDLAADGGGNCDPTRPDQRVDHEGVTVLGPTNLPATVPRTASQLYANNLVNFIENMLEDGELTVDTDDEIVDATLLTHDGTVRNPHRDDSEADDSESNGDGQPEEADDDATDGGESA
ncbi:NAD(P) transhydrogenase subunit alpha [Halorhabdus amylolytica]|uniref:NAD(P) transhydrogenase subunit alpha n=1 Tax=Halorhabdus amylolytica TaxID=2559573 RepID=UPI0010AA2624|nr:NAD(P) transhydrogenase subunit alpha [Halorhabdus amylolytica]